MENYMEYRLSNVSARMKSEIVPHIFPSREITNASLNTTEKTSNNQSDNVDNIYIKLEKSEFPSEMKLPIVKKIKLEYDDS